MQDKIFYMVCFGFIFGVLLHSFVFVNIFFLVYLFGISFLLILFYSYISKNKWGILIGFFILAFSFGIFRFGIAKDIDTFLFETKIGQNVVLSGIVSEEIDIRENSQKLIVISKIEKEEVKILVNTDLDIRYKYGDELNFEGLLKKPENFITDQGKEFDYINYLRKDGILYVMSFPKIKIVSHNNANKIKSILFAVKEKFIEKINLNIPNPENILMGGLILGEKSSFSQELRQSFIDSGTIHIVALSGYNVTIVAEWIMKLFSFLSLNFSIAIGILSIFLFVIMTGASSTAIRAGSMAILALIARATGRNYDVGRILVLVGVLMILFNPLILVYDISFQLSFLATVAVIFLAPRIEKYFLWITKKFEFRDIACVTTSAYILVSPFILYKIGSFSLFSVFANIFILPLIPFTMLLGFLVGFLGLFHTFIAVPFGYVSYILLHYELWIINLFANLPYAAFSFASFPLVFTILIYAYFIYKLFGRSIKSFFLEKAIAPL